MKEEAKGRFERWHLRQREIGACRCPECRDWEAAVERGIEAGKLDALARDLATAANASADTQFGQTKVKFVPKSALGLEAQALAHAEWRAKLLRAEADVACRSAEAAELTLAKLREKLHE